VRALAIFYPGQHAEIEMNRVILVAIGAIAFASATAYAQMEHGPQHGGPGMMRQMHEKMQKMHGKQGQQGAGHDHGTQTGAKPESAGAKKAAAGHAGHGTDGPRGDRGPSSAAFDAINRQMHEAMNITFTGNADVDFVQGMIPHHHGAVQMAKVVLAFGSDPEIKKLAQEVIDAQEREIAFMRAWLKRRQTQQGQTGGQTGQGQPGQEHKH
jgi:uncharacterized protein (DUF305 family)